MQTGTISRLIAVCAVGAAIVLGILLYLTRVESGNASELAKQRANLNAQLRASNSELARTLGQTTGHLSDATAELATAQEQLAESRRSAGDLTRRLADYADRQRRAGELIGSIVADAAAGTKLSDSGYKLDLAINNGLRALLAIVAKDQQGDGKGTGNPPH